MNYIHDSNGDIVGRSKNLRGIRSYASEVSRVESVCLTGFADGTGLMAVFYHNGASSTVNFADFTVLQKFVRNWRNARGAGLVVNGISRGEVTTQEPVGYPACVEVLS